MRCILCGSTSCCGEEFEDEMQRQANVIAELDGKIRQLEALVEKLKCCENCKHHMLDLNDGPCNMCDETDDRWEA
jgi:hypothetical protein